MTDPVCANGTKRILIPMLKYCTVESMEDYLDSKERHGEFEDLKEVPPMALIFLQSFMERAWTWDRLVPWREGCVAFKHYMQYLEKYFEKNASALPNVGVAAENCLKMENKYVDKHGGSFGKNDTSLSCKIIQVAKDMRDSGISSVTAAAGLMCIADETRLMSKQESDSTMFKFGRKVRRVALKLITHGGPDSQSFAAGMMGMAKEARIARELLKKIEEPESFESFEVCKEARECSLRLLIRFESNLVCEAPATSTTDKTEGKSADCKFAGTNNSMDIDENKNKKKDSEGMAMSSVPRL